jgi:RNA polymerase sigma-70 factor (ECF subfamily)
MLVRRYVRDDAAVDDVLQTTMLKTHGARGRFALRGDDPDRLVAAWYHTIARNAAVEHLRRRKRERRTIETREDAATAQAPDPAPTAEEMLCHDESERTVSRRVHAALARLPEAQRQVVELHKLEGLPMADVAHRLSATEGAVRVRAHRAYKTLARLLTASNGSGERRAPILAQT